MKYGNFTKASQLVEQIDKTSETLEELSKDSISARVMFGQTTIMTIGTFADSEHECAEIGKRFIEELIQFHKSKQNRLLIELERL
jgi:hypothetical protein